MAHRRTFPTQARNGIVLLFGLGFRCAAVEPAFCGPSTTPPEQANAYYRAVDISMADMHRAMESAARSGDVDRDFALAMIPHHQGAIDMARALLLNGKDPAMRRLAEQVITEQSLEIALMKRYLAESDVAGARATAASSSNVVETARPPDSAAQKETEPRGISGRDRVYTADQISNTVSVIDPATNRLLGVIPLGDSFSAALSPLYRGQLLVHGLGFSPDHRTLAVVSIGSNSVTLIDTATNKTKGVVYVGRSPHEAFFTPDGRELWVAVRGEDYISVIDPVELREVNRIRTTDGPAMVLFRPDGKFAFVPSSFTPELTVIDVRTRSVVARVKQASPFSPNLAISPDGKEVWFTLKDIGKVQVISADPPFDTLATVDVGPLCNHVALIDVPAGKFAYLTVGGTDEVQVWRRGPTAERVASIPTGDLPHGIWSSADGSRVYVSLENGDAVQVIDTRENRTIATIPVGRLPQAIVYVPGAVPAGTTDMGALRELNQLGQAFHLRLVAADDSAAMARGNAVVNTMGLQDHLQFIAAGLEPGREYVLSIEDETAATDRPRIPLARAKANPAGVITLQALGPLRQVATDETHPTFRQRLVLSHASDQRAVLLQVPPTKGGG